MPKMKLILPDNFSYTTTIPIRITDLNYGGHVGNDSVLSLIHEARVQFLRHHGYTELDMAGVGLIMADTTIEFKNELFYGEELRASVAPSEFSRIGFDLYYKLEKSSGEKWIPVVLARTGMICYNYSAKKVVSMPKEVCTVLLS
ncbi:MAG: thioesterase family protein [Bacteroidota bacterium]